MNRISPTTLFIEGNASCQLRCPTCPTTGAGYPPVVGSGYLRFRDLKGLLDANPRIRTVELENRGELFLNPELLRIIELAYTKGVAIRSSSGVNLNRVGEGVLEGLVKYGFRGLVCSVDGATPETYAIYRRGGDFLKVMEHLRTINHFKKAYNSEYPKLTWQFVVFGHNEHEIPRARAKARELGMGFVTKMSWDSELSPIRDREFVMAETGWPAVTREEYAKAVGREYQRNVCLALWNSPRINWDGKVLGCCWNSWCEFGGNAFVDGYVNAINSEGIVYARKMLMGRAAPREDIPCTTCELYVKMRQAGDYVRVRETLNRYGLYRACRSIYRASGLGRAVGLLRGKAVE